MKHPKPQSFTTDTRLSQSNFFNSSLLNKTNITLNNSNKAKNQHMNIRNGLQNNSLIHHNKSQQNYTYQNKLQNTQVDFLKVKNLQLQQRVKRMAQQVKNLQQNKIYLLGLNKKYVKVVNQYYKDKQQKKNKGISNVNIHDNINRISIQNISQQTLNTKQNSKLKPQLLSDNKQRQDQNRYYRCYSTSKYQANINQQNKAQVILTSLQKDHRNLVKHCLAMQNQIKNYSIQMQKFNQMKAQLFAVNHTSPKQLIGQLQETTEQNKQLKKQNNRLNFQLQKSKLQVNKLKKARDNQNKQLNLNGDQTEKIKAQINKVIQESTDKSSQYQQKIYSLQLKVQKLQKQLRFGQQYVIKNQQKRKDLQIQRVQNVHENIFLKANLTQLLDPKKHPLLCLDRGFIYHKKKQNKKIISLNTTATRQ